MDEWHEILQIDDLERSIRVRETMDLEHVRELAQILRDGGELDPVRVIRDGDRNVLVDGNHRIGAHADVGRESIDCLVRNGTYREAVLLAAGANGRHGLRRTNADKRLCVEMVLRDPEWAQWSDREIAAACCVSHTYVWELRRELSGRVNVDDEHAWPAGKERKPRGERDDEREPDTRAPSERAAPREPAPPPAPAEPPAPAAPDPAEDDGPAYDSPIPIPPEDRARLVFAAMFPAPEGLTPEERVEREVTMVAAAIAAAEQSRSVFEADPEGDPVAGRRRLAEAEQ